MRIFLALALALPLLSAPLQAAPAAKSLQKPVFDPRAVAALDRAVVAYGKLEQLNQDFSVTAQFAGQTFKGGGNWRFERPGRARVQWESGEESSLTLSDGHTIYSSADALAFQTTPVESAVPHDALISVTQAIPTAAGLPLGLMMAGKSPLAPELGLNWQRVQFAATPKLDGVILVSPSEADGPREQYRLDFDRQTHLLVRVEKKSVYLPRPDAPRGTPPLVRTSVTSFSPRAAKSAPVRWTPPAGAKLLPPFHDPRLRVGASPFSLAGATLNGQKLSLEALKGKIVLLDFWATWCGPCLAELPNLKADYAKYHARGLEIVGISLDAEQSDLRAFVRKRAVPWPQIFDGGIYTGANANAYGLTALPLTILVGRNGKIAAVGPRGWRLNLAIARALKATN